MRQLVIAIVFTVGALVNTAVAAESMQPSIAQQNDADTNIYDHIAKLVKQKAPSGSYSDWENKVGATREVNRLCTFVCVSLTGGPGLKPDVALEIGQTCLSTCLAKALPPDWPGHAKARASAYEHFERSLRLGSPAVQSPTIEP